MHHKFKQSGFTLVELLVAVAITVGMLVIIGAVYQQTGNAVSRGIGLSHIIANNRGINGIISHDGDAMLGPGSKGFLVVANHSILAEMPGVKSGMADAPPSPRPGWFKDPNHSNEHLEWIRDDQIVFVRNQSDDSDTYTAWPLAVLNPLAYDSHGLSPSSKPKIIVWYGHGVRTNPQGNFTGTIPANPSGLGVDPTNNDKPYNSRNALASQWIFARQAMFLADTQPSSPLPYSNDPRPDKGSIVWPGGNLANGSDNYMGTCDVAWYGYDADINGGIIVGNSSSGALLNTGLNASGYQSEAIQFLYAGNHRLHVNVAPTYNNGQLTRWQIAQMHSAFAVNVSDIEIAFAADITDGTSTSFSPDTHLDRTTTTYFNSKGDTILPEGSIKWYVAQGYQNTPGDTTSNHGLGYNSNLPITFPAPSGYYPDSGDNPFLYGYAGDVFVWRHDTGTITPATGYDPTNSKGVNNNFWPYLIRIRYRMHDSKGSVSSGFHQQGVWFEHIIKVARN